VLLLFEAEAAATNGSKSLLASEHDRDSEDCTVEKNLSELETDPVAEKKRFKGAQGEDEGENIRGKKLGWAGGDL